MHGKLRWVSLAALPPAEGVARATAPRALRRWSVPLGCFTVLIVAGSALLSLPGMLKAGHLSLPDAVFLATSAATLTGLSTVPVSELALGGQAVLLVLFQCAGILIVTSSTLFLAVPGTQHARGSRQIVRPRWIEVEQVHPAHLVLEITLLTLSVQAAGGLVLYRHFRASGTVNPLFSAVFHAVSAFCNAGFTTAEPGTTPFAPQAPALITAMALVVLGGLGYVVLRDILRRIAGTKRTLALHTRVVLLATLVLIAAGTVAFLLFDPPAPGAIGPERSPLLESLFHAVSARTSGFSLPGRPDSPAAEVFTVLLMLVGGAPGSAAGGLKIPTVFVVLLVVLKGMNPKGNRLVLTRQKTAPEAQVFAVVFMLRALLILACAIVLLSATETLFNRPAGLTFGQIVFEAVSAFTATGLSSGASPLLSTPGKAILVLTMLSGRLGLLILVARTSSRMSGPLGSGSAASPRGRREEREVLPQGEVLLGV